MLISFIVPTYNSEKTIEKCIKSINKQKCKKEIIVVDGISTDKTIEILKRFELKIYEEKKKGAGPARNFGLKRTKGDYIAFIDSDVVLPIGWIKKCIKKLEEDKKIAGVGGPGIGIKKKIISECLDALLYGKSHRTNETFVNSLATMNVVYKKSIIKGIYFDENILIGEDPEFNFNIIKKGYKLLFSRSLKVYHYHPEKLSELIKKWYNYGKYYTIPYLRHKEMIGIDFYFRIFYFPALLLIAILSFFIDTFIYVIFVQFILLFFVYFIIGILNCRNRTMIAFPFVHMIKQLSHMLGIFVSIFKRSSVYSVK